jgi:hypothetical protein
MFLKLTCPNATLVNESFSCSLYAKSSNQSDISINVDFGDTQITNFILNDNSIVIQKYYSYPSLFFIKAYLIDYPHSVNCSINGKNSFISLEQNSKICFKIFLNYIVILPLTTTQTTQLNTETTINPSTSKISSESQSTPFQKSKKTLLYQNVNYKFCFSLKPWKALLI